MVLEFAASLTVGAPSPSMVNLSRSIVYDICHSVCSDSSRVVIGQLDHSGITPTIRLRMVSLLSSDALFWGGNVHMIIVTIGRSLNTGSGISSSNC